MNVEPDFGDTPIEDDPTGMRRLLASLPDPGPMPDDLTARILASIATEQAARRDLAGPEVPAVPISRDSVVTHISHRKRRRAGTPSSLRWLAAAAAVGVIGAGGFGVVRMLGGNFSGAANGAALTTPAAQSARAGDQESADGNAGAPPPVLSRELRLVVTSSGTDYTADDLARQAVTLRDRQDYVLTTGATSPLATVDGVQACTTALGIGAFSEVRVDEARFQGDPAAILLLRSEAGWVAYAVPPTCGDGSAASALAGPVALP